MVTERTKMLMKESTIPVEYLENINYLFSTYRNEGTLVLLIRAFSYGIIVGKQQDRARRKKSGVNAQ